MQAPIIVGGLTTMYRSSVAVGNMPFLAKPGEICRLLEPNWVGETSTLKTIIDLAQPASGRIEVYGKTVQMRYVNGKSVP